MATLLVSWRWWWRCLLVMVLLLLLLLHLHHRRRGMVVGRHLCECDRGCRKRAKAKCNNFKELYNSDDDRRK